MHCILQRKWSKHKMDGLRPLAFCLQQLLLHLVLEVPHGPLGHSILKMGIYVSVADVLAVSFAMVNECVVCESAMVSTVLFDLNAMMGGKFFECNFCLKRLL